MRYTLPILGRLALSYKLDSPFPVLNSEWRKDTAKDGDLSLPKDLFPHLFSILGSHETISLSRFYSAHVHCKVSACPCWRS